MTQSHTPLKPCPFCGGKTELDRWDNGYRSGFKAGCYPCRMMFSGHADDDREIPIAKWNTRAPDQMQDELVAALKLVRDKLDDVVAPIFDKDEIGARRDRTKKIANEMERIINEALNDELTNDRK